MIGQNHPAFDPKGPLCACHSHSLAQGSDLPDKADRIHELKTTDTAFRKLADEYHEVNRAIHRAETNIEPCSEDHEAKLRRERLFLKNQIATRLA